MFRSLKQSGASLSEHPRVVAFAFSATCLLASAMPVAAGSGTLGP